MIIDGVVAGIGTVLSFCHKFSVLFICLGILGYRLHESDRLCHGPDFQTIWSLW